MSRHIIQSSEEAPDGRRTAAAAERNVAPLTAALQTHLPAQGHVLEIASGTGQHVAAFAAAFPKLHWHPSDVDPGQRASIDAWRQAAGLANIAAPVALDIAEPWPVPPEGFEAALTVNLLHLIPEPFVSKLFHSARAALKPGGRLMIYGPFLRGASFASEGDRSFDASLRARDPAIGYKSVEAVSEAATQVGFTPLARDAMPASNLLLVFETPG